MVVSTKQKILAFLSKLRSEKTAAEKSHKIIAFGGPYKNAGRVTKSPNVIENRKEC